MPSKHKTTKKRPAKRRRDTRPTPAATPHVGLSARPPAEPPKLSRFRLSFRDGIAPREIEAASLEHAERAGRRLSGSFAYAEPA